MKVNLCNCRIEDVSFLLDKRFSEYNVYNYKIVVHGVFPDTFISDFFSRMQKFSYAVLLQKLTDDYLHVTFVSKLEPECFVKNIRMVVDNLSRLFKLHFTLF